MEESDHVKEIERRATDLQSNMEKYFKKTEGDVRTLLQLIRPPKPITTPVDFIFIQAILDSLNAQLTSFGNLSEGLITACNMIGQEG